MVSYIANLSNLPQLQISKRQYYTDQISNPLTSNQLIRLKVYISSGKQEKCTELLLGTACKSTVRKEDTEPE